MHLEMDTRTLVLGENLIIATQLNMASSRSGPFAQVQCPGHRREDLVLRMFGLA